MTSAPERLPSTANNVERNEIRARMGVEHGASDPRDIPDLRRRQRRQRLRKGGRDRELPLATRFLLGQNCAENFGHFGQRYAGAEEPCMSCLLKCHLEQDGHVLGHQYNKMVTF